MIILKTLQKQKPLDYMILPSFIGGSLAPLVIYIKLVKDPFKTK